MSFVRLWRSSMLLGLSVKLITPSDASSLPLVTKEYAQWWAQIWKNTSEKNNKVAHRLNSVEWSSSEEPDSHKNNSTDTGATRRTSKCGHLATKSSSSQEEDVGKSTEMPSTKRTAFCDNYTLPLALNPSKLKEMKFFLHFHSPNMLLTTNINNKTNEKLLI